MPAVSSMWNGKDLSDCFWYACILGLWNDASDCMLVALFLVPNLISEGGATTSWQCELVSLCMKFERKWCQGMNSTRNATANN
jgi:hypothetical protein